MKLKLDYNSVLKINRVEVLEKEEFGKELLILGKTEKYYASAIVNKNGNIRGRICLYRTAEEAVEVLENYKKRVQERKDIKELSKVKAKEKFAEVKVGDIFVGSWGYEAQLYDFFQVVEKKSGKVMLRELKKKREWENIKFGACSQGFVTPIKDEFENDKVFGKKLNADGGFMISTYMYCRPFDGVAREEGNWH